MKPLVALIVVAQLASPPSASAPDSQSPAERAPGSPLPVAAPVVPQTSAASAPQIGTVPPPRDPAPALPGFSNSRHDFLGPAAPLAQRCAPCHGSPPPPVWTRLPRDARDPRGQVLAGAEPAWRVADSTALCLSCHDGSLASAVDCGDDGREFVARAALVQPHRDHPVGVEYPRSGHDRRTFRRQYAPIAQLTAEGRIRLPNGRVECVSCHDPHNALGIPGMLVKSDRRSALCLSCHLK
ncbi:MAG: cytochrome c3 family protein [Phycisphaerae bacterium]